MATKRPGRSMSFDVDLARELGMNAAVIYNELLFWSDKGGRSDGWIYKSYDEMTGRLPMSESTIRRTYRGLETAGLIETTVMKVDDKPVLHYRLVSVNLTGTRETVNLTETTIYTESNHKGNDSELPKADEKPLDESALRLARLLGELIISDRPKLLTMVKKNGKGWVPHIEKAHRLDGFSWDDIELAIRFSQRDDFWKNNILSGDKLRKQLAQLVVKAEAEKRRTLEADKNKPGWEY